ncbi:MAG: hypothetical protein QGH13_02495 [Candidatus Thalassarchaeaceae archaeon]|nr:hypothetical protein [Candidatus Thalassarchaeaceae archaeon]
MNEIKVIQSEPGKEIIVRVMHSRLNEDAWIGLFKAGSGDNEHGDRWKWMRDVDVSHITLPAQGAGEWSVRLFKDGGYNRISYLDFNITYSGSSIEILEAVPGKPVRFRINNRPSSNDAWVGIYPVNAKDIEHGDRWGWLRDKHMDNASLPGQSEGRWSIRVFSDGGYTLHDRVDFDIPPCPASIEIFHTITRHGQHLHDPEKAAEFARALGLSVGGHHPFLGDWLVKGLYAYRSGKYKGQAYFGTGGSESDRLKDTYNSIKPEESHQKYRPWNRDDPKIPEDIRQKLIRLEDRMNQTSQPSTKPLSRDMLQGEISLKGVHGKYLSATPEGRVLWNTDVVHVGEYFRVEQRQNGKIALRGPFDMYVSAQPDGSVKINSREAPPGGWEEFTVEYRSNDVVYLKSCHGKYLSAQKDGPEWWDWTMRQEADAQEIQIEQFRKTSEPILSEPILNSDDKYVFADEHKGWHWHNERARAMGGHIASVTSAEENEEITRISGGAPVWLGGIRKGARYRGKPLAVADRKPGDPGKVGPGAEDWYWSDGRPWSYTNWGPGEPNNWDSAENRVQHLGKFGAVWNDVGEDWDGPAVYRIPAKSSSPEIDLLEQFKSKLDISDASDDFFTTDDYFDDLSSKFKKK